MCFPDSACAENVKKRTTQTTKKKTPSKRPNQQNDSTNTNRSGVFGQVKIVRERLNFSGFSLGKEN